MRAARQRPALQPPLPRRRHRLVQAPPRVLPIPRQDGRQRLRRLLPGRRRTLHTVRPVLGQQRLLLRQAQRPHAVLPDEPSAGRRSDPQDGFASAGVDRVAQRARVVVRTQGEDHEPRYAGIPGRVPLPSSVEAVHEIVLRQGGGSVHLPHVVDEEQGQQAAFLPADGRLVRERTVRAPEGGRCGDRRWRYLRVDMLFCGSADRMSLPRQAEYRSVQEQSPDR
mmetsp:Transcript_5666/g.15372  ORF Transcript_5666/g.15372 Transcript_5666/m.15372 type:complete len:223 (+) Transcript_5666:545-1213(+)